MDQDPRINARTAREGFARGLALLQDQNLPAEMLNAAEPIARAMGALLQIERTDGHARNVRPHAENALASAREALGKLQAIQVANPIAENALGAVAGSLGLVHALSKLQSIAPPAPAVPVPMPSAAPQPPQYAPPASTQIAARAPVAPQVPPPQAPSPPAAPAYAPPVQQYQPPPQQPAAPAAARAPAAPPPPVPQAPQAHQPHQPPPQAAPVASPQPARASASAPGYIGAPGRETMPPPAGCVEAELGAHSPSNFYKTLSGNDIVDHGGIFVATYAIPRINSESSLRIHLPGGYHFDCQAIVKWTREQRDNPDAPPGFGATMLGITAEQKQLIMRYVRNREPLFYDDL